MAAFTLRGYQPWGIESGAKGREVRRKGAFPGGNAKGVGAKGREVNAEGALV